MAHRKVPDIDSTIYNVQYVNKNSLIFQSNGVIQHWFDVWPRFASWDQILSKIGLSILISKVVKNLLFLRISPIEPLTSLLRSTLPRALGTSRLLALVSGTELLTLISLFSLLYGSSNRFSLDEGKSTIDRWTTCGFITFSKSLDLD